MSKRKKYYVKKNFKPIWERAASGERESTEEKYSRLLSQLSQLVPGWKHFNLAQQEHLVIMIDNAYKSQSFGELMKLSKLFFPHAFSDSPATFTPMQYAEFLEPVIRKCKLNKSQYIHCPQKRIDVDADDDEKKNGNDIRTRSFSWPEKQELFSLMCYFPHEQQIIFHSSSAKFIIVVAGTRGGKSYMTAHEALATFFLPDARIWLVGQQYDVADKEFDWIEERLLTWRIGDKSASEHFGLKIHKPKFGSRSITAPWGSFIQTKSCKEPDKLLGVELDLIVLCEPHHIAWKIWDQMLRGRLISRKGRAVGAATGCGYSTLMRKFLRRGLDEDPKWKDWFALSFSSEKNPYVPLEEFEAARLELDPKTFEEQFLGKIVDVRGNVFFLEDNLILETEKLEQKRIQKFKDFPNFLVYIYKSNNPSICLFCSVDPKDNKVYVVDELHWKTNHRASDHFLEIDGKVRGRNMPNKQWVFTLAEDKTSRKVIDDQGLVSMYNEEDLGLSKKDLLKIRVAALQDQIDQEQCIVTDNCPYLIESLRNSRWPEDEGEETGRENRELPLSGHLTAPLALASLLMYIELQKPGGHDYYRVDFRDIA